MNGPGTGIGRTGDGPGGGGDGIGSGPDFGGVSERPVEDRLRRAFTARAESIGIRDLRPAAPPRPAPRRGPLSAVRRLWLRRFGLPLAAAAAAAAVLGYLATAADGPPDRPQPARPPHSVSPSPDSTPTGPAPTPSRSEPSAGGGRSATPSGSPPPATGSARPQRSLPTEPSTARPSGRPSGSPSGTAPPSSATPSATAPAPQGGDKSNSPTTSSS
ncbi:hypothetical protein [Streptomyces sp. NEAU-S7GS2]|uniref:hypothetical protein n=1 Tax=Streptomyces sp. NEAU-S7GS2 TaxID=2202000 RepID=UPI000D6FA0BA|nr:hypothetical protein [Streptomyces sp. NEAU-S7GS2]AWN28503.1 hypothetical protein DKG71_22365 [Streptomyces sp. NEAU-S7GS2]